jgi:predicted dehydrogenase
LSHTTHRRDFLKQTALAGAGLWVVGSDLLAEDRSPNEKLNIGVIGVGGRGEGDTDGVKGENIVALCDVDAKTLGKAADKFPKAKTYRDFRKMLEEQKGLDAVVVATPDHTHAVATVMALKLGKHVYCEKPLTHSIAEARAVADAAKEARKATQMGNQGHSSEQTRQIVELIRSGAIGPVTEVYAWTDRPIWPQGMADRPKDSPSVPENLDWDLWLGPAAERPYHPDYQPFKWRGWWDFGTGALGDMACHIMDAAFWALDLKHPSSVEAEGEPRSAESPPKSGTVRYQFPARGDLPPLTLTWTEKGNRPSRELAEGQEVPDNGTLYIGAKGKLFVPDAYSGKFKLLPEKTYADFKAPEKTLRRSPGHHAEWIRACKTGDPTGSNFEYAAALTEMVLLGNVAFRVGQKLEWDPATMRARNCSEADQYIRYEYRKGWSL